MLRPDVGEDKAGRGERIAALSLRLLERSAAHIWRSLRAGQALSRHAVLSAHGIGHLSAVLAYLASRKPYAPGEDALSVDECAAAAIGLLRAADVGKPIEDGHIVGAVRPNGFATGYPGLALLWLGDCAPADIAQRVREGVAAGADWYLSWRCPSGLFYDTKAEEIAWEVTTLAIAQALLPDHPHRRAWHEKAREMVLNSYSRECDVHDGRTRFDGLPLSRLVYTANVFPDFTTHNHEGFNTCYQVCHKQFAAPYHVYRDYLGGVPEWFTWNWAGLHEVVKKIVLRDGYLMWPGGCDYWPYTHVGYGVYHALMAEALRCGLSLWCVEKTLLHAVAEQDANGDGALCSRRRPNFSLAWQATYTGFVIWEHLFAPYKGVAEIGGEEAEAARGGAFVSDHADIVVQNRGRLASSFCWQPVYAKGQALGSVLPSDDSGWSDVWSSIPNLVGTVRLKPGHERRIEPCTPDGYISHYRVRGSDPGELPQQRRRHAQGRIGGAVWSIGHLLDSEGDVLHTVGTLAAPDAVVHIERFVKYGEKQPIGGVEALNYHLENNPVDRPAFHVAWSGGEADVTAIEWEVPNPGDVLVFDRKLALVRLHGNTRLRVRQFLSAPLRQGRRMPLWRLRVWGDPLDPAVPPGYGLMAEQATAFLPAKSVAEARGMAGAIRVETFALDEWRITVSLPDWLDEFLVCLGPAPGVRRLCERTTGDPLE